MSTQVYHSPPPAAVANKTAAVPHFGKAMLTRQEAREHNEFLAQAKRFHPCPICNGGEYRLFRCETCQGRHFLLPAALVKRLGLERFLLTAAEERSTLSAEDEAAMQEVQDRREFEEDPYIPDGANPHFARAAQLSHAAEGRVAA